MRACCRRCWQLSRERILFTLRSQSNIVHTTRPSRRPLKGQKGDGAFLVFFFFRGKNFSPAVQKEMKRKCLPRLFTRSIRSETRRFVLKNTQMAVWRREVSVLLVRAKVLLLGSKRKNVVRKSMAKSDIQNLQNHCRSEEKSRSFVIQISMHSIRERTRRCMSRRKPCACSYRSPSSEVF